MKGRTTHTTKQSNIHKAHPTECERCGRLLPKQVYRPTCATCIKAEQGKPANIGYGGPKRKKEAA